MVTQILGEVTKGADLDKSRGFGGLNGSFLFFGDGFEKKPPQAMFLRNLGKFAEQSGSQTPVPGFVTNTRTSPECRRAPARFRCRVASATTLSSTQPINRRIRS